MRRLVNVIVCSVGTTLALCGCNPMPTMTPQEAGAPGAAPAQPTNVPPPECTGTLPQPVGAGFEYHIATALGVCREPITDGAGAWVGLGIGIKQSLYQMVRSSEPGQLGSVFQLALAGERNEQDLPVAPQPSGYHAINPGSFAAGPFRRYDSEGHLLSEGGTLAPGLRIRSLPGGGSAVYTLENDPQLGRTTYRLEMMDAFGGRRAAAVLDRPCVNHAVSTKSHVLVLSIDSARWFDSDARPLTPWFGVPASAGTLDGAQLMPLADGAIALANGAWPTDRSWRALFVDAVPASSEVPEWLSSRPETRVFVVRGGRANAIVGSPYPKRTPSASTCNNSIELVTSSGQSCGTVTVDAMVCASTLFVGIDGTVFSMTQSQDGLCSWRWWPALLR